MGAPKQTATGKPSWLFDAERQCRTVSHHHAMYHNMHNGLTLFEKTSHMITLCCIQPEIPTLPSFSDYARASSPASGHRTAQQHSIAQTKAGLKTACVIPLPATNILNKLRTADQPQIHLPYLCPTYGVSWHGGLGGLESRDPPPPYPCRRVSPHPLKRLT
jgi:hypothetical protein